MSNTFSKYLGTPYQPHIRPAIPPDGALAPNSRIELEKRGKVPGLWSGKDWIGLPGFDFVDAGYGLTRVNFHAGAGGNTSGTFGVIDRHLVQAMDPPVWTQHVATPTPVSTVGHRHLGGFMAEMVDGTRGGCGRLATPSLGTDWSKTVERLLEVTYGQSFHHRQSFGPSSMPRGVSACAFLRPKAMAAWMNMQGWPGRTAPPIDGIEIREVDDRPMGISVLHIGLDDTAAEMAERASPPKE